MNNLIDGPSLVALCAEEGTHMPPDWEDPSAVLKLLAPLNDDAVKAPENVLLLTLVGVCFSHEVMC